MMGESSSGIVEMGSAVRESCFIGYLQMICRYAMYSCKP
jgi:hypothetical protein